MVNDGTLTLAGTVTGNVVNSSTITVDGSSNVVGVIDNNEIFNAASDIAWDVFNNNGSFNVDPGISVGSGSGLLTNSSSTSSVNLSNNSAIEAALLNNGTLSVEGSATLGGGLTGNGTVDLEDGATDDTLSVTGDLASSGLEFVIDADLSGTTSATDNVVITGGALTGDITLSFKDIGEGFGDLTSPIEVFSYDAAEANDFSFETLGLGVVGTTLYFVDEDAAAGLLNLVSASDPNLGGLTGAVVLTQSLIGSVVNRPSSPFVVGVAIPGDRPCGPGTWARQTGGVADARATIDSSSPSGGTATIDSEVSANYRGVQLGVDLNCSDGFYNGWDLAYGGLFGFNDGNTVQPVFGFDTETGTIDASNVVSVNNTDFQQIYFGGYVSAFKDGLLLDLQYRIEDTSFDLENSGATDDFERGGVVDQSFGSQSQTLGGSLSYQIPLIEEERVNLTPTVGFSITQTSVDTIQTIDNGDLVIEDFTNRIGFAGATLSKTIIAPNGSFANTIFGTVTYYNDFTETIDATLDGSTITSSSLGAFTEIGVGMNYIQLLDGDELLGLGARQVNASVRVDGKFSDSVDAWGFSAQMRLDF